MSAPEDFPDERLPLLKAFRAAVWGNNRIFKENRTYQSGSGQRTVEYLNFGAHAGAVSLLCDAVEGEKLLIPQEYRDAMNMFRSEDSEYRRGACIVGQPGIGKSCFVAYAVIERLREMQPVAVEVSWTTPGGFVLFSPTVGVSLHCQRRKDILERFPGMWVFSDSSHKAIIPTGAFLSFRIRVFQTASPQLIRWKNWSKERKIQPYWMDLWSATEIEDLAFISDYNHTQVELMNRLAQRWGRVPRVLSEAASIPGYERSYQSNFMDALNTACNSPTSAWSAIMGKQDTHDLGPSAVFFVKPAKTEDGVERTQSTVFVPTPWIADQLLSELHSLKEKQRVEFFEALRATPVSRSVAGSIFEQLVHHFLVGGHGVTIKWLGDNQSTQTLHLPKLNTCILDSELQWRPPFYWRPDAINFSGIDSAIVTEDTVYTIQATISPKHTSPQKGVDKLWGKMPQSKRALSWKHLFIGSSESQTESVSESYVHVLRYGYGGQNKPYLPVGGVTLNHFLPDNLWEIATSEPPGVPMDTTA